ncbi:hypothetical protein BJ508DRAFT_47400 [Ascobolus immersus RN42]|uniref:C3H1-type domain-containing protein n=1 Tax=Ascobolus immersus RN42 TaxID=1160509 RepID=A0A3N4IEN9_ASCIM|nr:hypothetical protein BJ508DRAFT_47400 [Ascobolus immersus RN42]
MPPKGKGEKPKAAKVVADKTFGLKNKKGAKVQKQVAQIAQQASQAKTPEQRRKEAEKAAREREKIEAEKAKAEVAALFKPVIVQKVPFGVDPKSVLCQFFKKGNCEKGKKCKFSHDPDVERKQEKKNLYEDARSNEKKEDTMDKWDEAKLNEVILSKHGNPKTTTDKVCKFFIEAVENGKYGWFWTCPNGGNNCKYVHALPPGFVLKTKEQKAAEKALMDKSPMATLTLEDFLEIERSKLVSGTGTPVTDESFKKWKAERLSKKEAEEAARKAQEATGRALFEKGGWQNDSSDEDSDDEGDDSGGFDLAKLREETARLLEEREKQEEREIAERNAAASGAASGSA